MHNFHHNCLCQSWGVYYTWELIARQFHRSDKWDRSSTWRSAYSTRLVSGKSGPALGSTEYRLMPSACRLIVRQRLWNLQFRYLVSRAPMRRRSIVVVYCHLILRSTFTTALSCMQAFIAVARRWQCAHVKFQLPHWPTWRSRHRCDSQLLFPSLPQFAGESNRKRRRQRSRDVQTRTFPWTHLWTNTDALWMRSQTSTRPHIAAHTSP